MFYLARLRNEYFEKLVYHFVYNSNIILGCATKTKVVNSQCPPKNHQKIYCKVASSDTSCLEAHAGFFWLLMKGIFDPSVLWPFDKKLISQFVTRVITCMSILFWELTIGLEIFENWSITKNPTALWFGRKYIRMLGIGRRSFVAFQQFVTLLFWQIRLFTHSRR